MSDGVKNIRFKFELDNQSFKQVQDAVKGLVADLQKLGNVAGGAAFPGLSIGGAAPNKSTQVAQGNQKAQGAGGGTQQTMGKVILDNAQAFKKFAAEGKDASKVMTEALKRDIGAQERALDGLKSKLVNLNDEFKLATQRQKEFLTAGDKTGASAMGKYIQQLEGRIAETSGQTLSANKTLAGSQDALKGMGGGPGGFAGFMQNIGYTGTGFGGPGGGMGALLKGIGAAVAGGIAVGSFAVNEIREGGGGVFAGSGTSAGQGGMDIRAEARRGGLINGRIRALRRGDLSQLMINEEIRKDSNKSAYYNQQMDALAQLASYKKGAEAGAANLPVLGALAAKVGLIDSEKGVTTTLEGLTTAAVEDRILKNIQGVEGDVSASSNFLDRQMAMEHFGATYASRVNAQRMMGMTLEGRRVNGKLVGRYGDFAANMAAQQLGEGAYLGNYASLRATGGGRFAGSLAGYETLSQAGGFSGFGAMAAQANRGVGSGAEALQLARAALGGGIATGAGMQLGSMLFGYNPLGTTSGEGLLSAIQGGVNWNGMSEGQQFNKVQALGGAMNMGNAIARGSLDPYTLGASTIYAKGILGTGASTRAIDYLASGMDFKQMADIGFGKSGPTAAMDVYGIGKSDVRKMAASKLGSLLKPELSDPATGATVSKIIKGLESGLSPEAALKGLNSKERKEFDVALQNRTRIGGEEAGALGDIFSGLGLSTRNRKLKRGDALGSRLSGVEGAEAERQAQEIKRQEGVLREENTQGKMEAKIKNTQEAAKAQKDFGTNLGSSVEVLVKHLDLLANAIGDAASKINGKSGMKPMKATGGQ